jgi:hypothetical protein
LNLFGKWGSKDGINLVLPPAHRKKGLALFSGSRTSRPGSQEFAGTTFEVMVVNDISSPAMIPGRCSRGLNSLVKIVGVRVGVKMDVCSGTGD